MLPDFLVPSDEQLRRSRADYVYLHQHPEPSGREYQTAAWLGERFAALGYRVYRIGETGLAAVLCHGSGPVVAFRTDTDALPITEQTGVAWASTATTSPDEGGLGLMHACGHDIHMTAALHIAELLARSTEHWSGTVEFICQPSEENVRGAREMLAAGLWETIPVAEVVFGQHVFPIPAGQLQLAPGPFFSTVDAYRIDIVGCGGHGSMPETTVDALVLTATIVTRLQTIVSREIGLHEKAVLTIGSMHAGSKENIIPGHGELLVSTRSYSEDIRARMQQAIERIVHAEALAAGAPEPTITPLYRAASIVNDPTETERILAHFRADLGADSVVVPDQPMSASEDFGYLAEAIGAPSVYWVFGGYQGMTPGQAVPTNHSPHFLPTPGPSLTLGIAAGCSALWSRLSHHG